MDYIATHLKSHYSNTFDKHGASAKGVDWKSEKEADIRYKVMLSVIRDQDIKSQKRIRILDVGCGYGGQYQYAKKLGLKVDYTGIDVVPEMIEFAKENLKDAKFIYADVINFSPKKPFDYVICNGILTQKLTASSAQMQKYANKLIKKMFSLAQTGIVFNVMTDKVDYKKRGNYYVSPAKMLTEALKHTRYVKIDHSYPLYEYAVFMYKEKK